MQSAGKRLSKLLAESCHNSLDPRNVVVLGEDKRAKRLPGVLPQDAHARREARRLAHHPIARQRALDRAVIGVQVEIMPPERLEVPWRAATELHNILPLINRRPAYANHTGPAAVRSPFPTEALAAIQNFVQAKILQTAHTCDATPGFHMHFPPPPFAFQYTTLFV